MVFRPDVAVSDLGSQNVQPVGRVGVAVCHRRVIGLQHQGHVAELVAQCAAAALPGREQGLRAYPGRLQLVHGGEQHPLQFRLAAGRAVDLQPGIDLIQCQRHAKHTPALVQHTFSGAPLAGHGAPGKSGEAEHLRVQGQGVPAAAAQLPLRLVAVLLGHNEHTAAPALTYKGVDLRYDGSRFSGARFAGEKSEHICPPKLSFFSILSNMAPAYKPPRLFLHST